MSEKSYHDLRALSNLAGNTFEPEKDIGDDFGRIRRSIDAAYVSSDHALLPGPR